MNDEPIVLDPSQERAVELMLEAPIGVVTGGPGRGKTTIVKHALEELDLRGETVALASPTGKAARRLMEATGREASTVHRLLGWTPNGWIHTADNPVQADVVIVDESSMLDLELAAALFAATVRSRLILVGDVDQLPSVGPGRVLGDLIDSGRVPVARLEVLHRAALKSWVCRNAPKVLAGEEPELAECDDFRFVECSDSGEVADAVVHFATESKGELQILTPQNPGPAGTVKLATRIQEGLNPKRRGEFSWKVGDFELRIRDRVIHTRNDYQLGVFNGEVGEVVFIDAERLVVAFDERQVEYNRGQAEALRLAYALTIHKFQGSEAAHVCVVCHSTHAYSLSRALLYTGITRAKKSVLLIGNRQGIKAALKARGNCRNTSLAERLRLGDAELETA